MNLIFSPTGMQTEVKILPSRVPEIAGCRARRNIIRSIYAESKWRIEFAKKAARTAQAPGNMLHLGVFPGRTFLQVDKENWAFECLYVLYPKQGHDD